MMMEYFAALGNEWGLSLSFTQTISSKSFSEAAMSEKIRMALRLKCLMPKFGRSQMKGLSQIRLLSAQPNTMNIKNITKVGI